VQLIGWYGEHRIGDKKESQIMQLNSILAGGKTVAT